MWDSLHWRVFWELGIVCLWSDVPLQRCWNLCVGRLIELLSELISELEMHLEYRSSHQFWLLICWRNLTWLSIVSCFHCFPADNGKTMGNGGAKTSLPITGITLRSGSVKGHTTDNYSPIIEMVLSVRDEICQLWKWTMRSGTNSCYKLLFQSLSSGESLEIFALAQFLAWKPHNREAQT